MSALLIALLMTVPAPTVPEPVPTTELWCYLDQGGVWCHPAGSPEAEQAALDQAAYYVMRGLEPSTEPWEVRYVEAEPATTTTVPMECFNLAGGTLCYPVGSSDAAVAAELEAEYLGAVASTSTSVLASNTAPPPTTAPATGSVPLVIETTPPIGHSDGVEVAVGLPPVPPGTVAQLLPETGDGSLLLVVALGFLSFGSSLVAVARLARSRP